MKRGKKIHCEGIDLGDGVVIEEAHEEGYKYLGILERDDIYQEKIQEKTQKDYYKRVRAILNTKLNGENAINTIIIWAVATARYGIGIILAGIRKSWIRLTDKNGTSCLEYA